MIVDMVGLAVLVITWLQAPQVQISQIQNGFLKNTILMALLRSSTT